MVTLYKVRDLVPKTGNYRCTVCGHVMEFKEGDLFQPCPVCQAGTEEGPKGPEEDFWELI